MELCRKGLALLGIILFAAFLLTGCFSKSTSFYIDFEQSVPIPIVAAEDEISQRPILIALATVLSPHETINYYRQIANYVSQKTGRPAVLIQRKTYEEVNILLANGDVDIAFMSTGAYSSYRGMNEIELLVMAEYEGTILYNAEIIVHRDSEIYRISDLQGKTFAFTDPLSYSGHMVIEDYLRKKGTLPELYFKRYFYTYSHDKSLWAVANRVADGASLDSQILDYARVKSPELVDKVRIIATIGPAPTGPIAIKKNMNTELKEQLRHIFLDMHHDAIANTVLKKLIIHRFVNPSPELYQPLQKLYDRTGMNL